MIRRVESVALVSYEGRRLEFSEPESGGEDNLWIYTATLVLENARASLRLWDHGRGLAELFRRVASDWRGFSDSRSFASLEGNLCIDCTHDGIGTVEIEVVLRDPSPPTWSTAATLHFGGGADLLRAADELEAFVNHALQ
jgi:hypothetical protein